MLLALALSFDAVAEPVAKAVGTTKDKLTGWARTALMVLIGVWLVQSGTASLAVPWIGIPLIIVGVSLVAYALWPYFTKPTGNMINSSNSVKAPATVKK